MNGGLRLRDQFAVDSTRSVPVITGEIRSPRWREVWIISTWGATEVRHDCPAAEFGEQTDEVWAEDFYRNLNRALNG
jgi:hypothetical protein